MQAHRREANMDPNLYARQLSDAMGGTELAFSRAQYDERIAAVRRSMAEIDLDLLLVTHTSDLNYLTGYDTLGVDIYACLILPLEGEPVLHTMTVEIPAAAVTTWIDDVVFMDWYLPENTGTQLAGLVAARGLGRGRIGIQPCRQGLRPDVLGHLESGLSSSSLVDASDLVARLRIIKAPEEIECLRRAAGITAEGIDASLAAIRQGATDNDVCQAGFTAMLTAGSDFLAIQPIVTTGRRTGGAHQTHRRQRIKAGDAVFMEYGGCFKRYTAPLMRCALLGTPDDEMRRVEDTVRSTVQVLIDNIRPGRIFHDVAMEGRRAHAEIDDISYFSGAYGYTIGVGYPPTWADTIGFIGEGVEEELQPGMTFHLPIAMRIPGRYGVSLSESVLVTETGCEVLTDHPRELRLIAS